MYSAPEGAAERKKSRLGPPVQRRHHLDAGQVGVPVVRSLGPGVPLHTAGAYRPGLCEGAVNTAPSRMVHAPERTAAGLRVGVRGREPTGACVGGMARLQD